MTLPIGDYWEIGWLDCAGNGSWRLRARRVSDSTWKIINDMPAQSRMEIVNLMPEFLEEFGRYLEGSGC